MKKICLLRSTSMKICTPAWPRAWTLACYSTSMADNPILHVCSAVAGSDSMCHNVWTQRFCSGFICPAWRNSEQASRAPMATASQARAMGDGCSWSTTSTNGRLAGPQHLMKAAFSRGTDEMPTSYLQESRCDWTRFRTG